MAWDGLATEEVSWIWVGSSLVLEGSEAPLVGRA